MTISRPARPLVGRAMRLALVGLTLLATACGVSGRPGVVAVGPLAAAAADPALEAAFNNPSLERIDLNEPLARKFAGNTDKKLFKLIRGAKQSLDGAFYDIEDMDVAKAFVAAKARGVAIRLVTDTDNMVDKVDPTKPRPAIVLLKAAGIPIVEDQRSAIMHHKFLVADKQVVWMGSTNLTTTSLYRHNNNALTLHSVTLALSFAHEFERLFTKHEFGRSTRTDVPTSSPEITVGNASVRVFFSPDGGGRKAVIDELAAAKKRIRFMTFSLTDVETGATMLAKAQAGVKVSGVFDRWLAAGEYSLFDKFRGAKLEVFKDGNEALMHHKVILVDDQVLITGSYNFSQNAEQNNNEAFLIIHQAPALSRAYDKEFERLVYAAKHNHPPAVKRPDAEKKTGDTP